MAGGRDRCERRYILVDVWLQTIGRWREPISRKRRTFGNSGQLRGLGTWGKIWSGMDPRVS